MMTGDLNFNYVSKDEGQPWPFELASLVPFFGVIITVTIVAGNLLIGLTAGDVAVSVSRNTVDTCYVHTHSWVYRSCVDFFKFPILENSQGGGCDSSEDPS